MTSVLQQNKITKKTTELKALLCALLLLALNPFVLVNAEILSIDLSQIDIQTPYNISRHLQVLEDINHNITSAQIMAGIYDSQFSPVEKTAFITEHKNHRYWFRMRVNAASLPDDLRTDAVLYVPLQPVLIWHLTLDIYADGKKLNSAAVGHLEPFDGRDIVSKLYAFHLPLKDFSTLDIIGSVSNADTFIPAVLPFHLVTKDGFHQVEIQHLVIYMAFYAAMVALFIYNLFLFLSLRIRVYGYYLMFLLAAVSVAAVHDGSNAQWLFPHSPRSNQLLNLILGIALSQAYIAFIFNSIDGAKHFPTLLPYYRGVVAVGFLINILNCITDIPLFHGALNQIYPTTIMLSVLVLIILSFKRGIPIAIIMFAGELVMLAGANTYMLMYSGIAPVNDFTNWSMHWGFLGESLLLSLALAYRTRIAQRESLVNLERYEQLYQQSPVALFEYSFTERNLKGNLALAELFGFPSIADLPKNVGPTDFFNEEDRRKLPELMARTGALKDYEITIYREQTGELVWISLSMKVFNNKDGKPDRVEGTMSDITARVTKEEAAQAQRQALAENKAKSEFISHMSHEIRTPMTGIIGMAELLRDQLSQPSHRQYIEIVLSSASALLNLINDILDYSKIAAGKMTLESIPINLEKIAYDSLAIFKVIAHNKGVRLVLSIPPDLPQEFLGDPTRLKQVLINFTNNAIKFTSTGSVMLAIEYREPERYNVSLSVADTGIGISADGQKKLFQAFAQVNEDTARKFGGTGLGLSISKQLIEMMGGSVAVQSTEGEGSTFSAQLYLRCTDKLNPLIAAANTKALRDLSVVISTFDMVERHWMEELCRQYGFHVMSAEDLSTYKSTFTSIGELPDLFIVCRDTYAKKYAMFTKLQQRSASSSNGSSKGPAVLILHDGIAPLQIDLPRTAQLIVPFLQQEFAHCLGVLFAIEELRQTQPLHSLPLVIPAQKSLTILVAEDNGVNSLVIEKLLKRFGHQSTIVENGRLALDAYKKRLAAENPFDIILMDCEMPEMDGFEATQLIRQWEKEKDLPPIAIYALTAHVMSDELEHCQQVGMNGRLSKPIDQQALQQALNSCGSKSTA